MFSVNEILQGCSDTLCERIGMDVFGQKLCKTKIQNQDSADIDREEKKKKSEGRGRRRMRDTTKMKAFRSGLVVIGAVAFGYLNLQLIFKPFLEKQQALLHSDSSQQQQQQQQQEAELLSDFYKSESDQRL